MLACFGYLGEFKQVINKCAHVLRRGYNAGKVHLPVTGKHIFIFFGKPVAERRYFAQGLLHIVAGYIRKFTKLFIGLVQFCNFVLQVILNAALVGNIAYTAGNFPGLVRICFYYPGKALYGLDILLRCDDPVFYVQVFPVLHRLLGSKFYTFFISRMNEGVEEGVVYPRFYIINLVYPVHPYRP